MHAPSRPRPTLLFRPCIFQLHPLPLHLYLSTKLAYLFTPTDFASRNKALYCPRKMSQPRVAFAPPHPISNGHCISPHRKSRGSRRVVRRTPTRHFAVSHVRAAALHVHVSSAIRSAYASTHPFQSRSPKRVPSPGSSFPIRRVISRFGCLSGRSAIGNPANLAFPGEKVGFALFSVLQG